MEIRNLREIESEILQNVVQKMQEVSPEISYRTFKQGEEPKVNDTERLDALEQKIDKLISKIELIFGDSVLIDGRFRKI